MCKKSNRLIIMKKIEITKILVPVDFSEHSDVAVSNAVTLARLLNADLFLIHVIEFNGYHFSMTPETDIIYPPLMELKTVVEKKLDKMRSDIKKRFGILSKIYIASGLIHTEIIDYSKKKKIDLIVMGTHGVSGYKELFTGSNAQRVVTLSEVPVLTLQKNARALRFKNILIPIDNSLHSREKVNLAMIIANVFGSKIHIVGLPPSKDKLDLNRFKIKCESVEKIVHADKLPCKTTIAGGENLAAAALRYASKNKCSLIVINTGHESKSTGIFLGGFAQQIVNHSKVPVLSFKHSEGHYSIDTPGFGIS